ncbi:MAG: FAD-dependent monooxygenase [Aliidiomarina sp.]|uniref:FAD-dependent monooxygenase n=1 Tax=Aliidiomarina sp. TaxID=1872439 RepID=UPI0025B8298A|nr:FAD-dependent monooxygenase [Aliidiomarina sp.]MCH8502650.1 FAD-dependent monooxygenase [Aliidiomarina sp.]
MKNSQAQTTAENALRPWVVVGGGMVGAAMALSLASSGRRVVVLEPQLEAMLAVDSATYSQQPYDLRISAVTADNIALLQALESWSPVAAVRAQPFRQLAVREQGGDWLRFGAEGERELGYMVENKLLQACLLQRLQQHPGVELMAAKVLSVADGTVSLDSQEQPQLAYEWLVVADGAASATRRALGIGTVGASYHERCLLTVVKLQQSAGDETWQTFAGREVHALLPLCDDYACLIVYADSPVIQAWQQSQAMVEAVLKARFRAQLGDFELINFASFPLQHQQALRTFCAQQRALVIGDAAHAIHPLAGQGVNLGLRDVAALHALVADFTDEHQQLSAKLARVMQQRQAANVVMGQGLDIVSRVFRSDNPVLQVARGLGFVGLRQFPTVRSMLAKLAGQS